MSLFSLKTSTPRSSWAATWEPGINLANLFSLYTSKGAVTVSTDTQLVTDLDGPIKVFRYDSLTVNAALTFSNRCRGAMILADSLSVGATGSISMTARGAWGSHLWATTRDIMVPSRILFTGKNTSWADFLAWIRSTGYCIFDPTLYASPPPGMGDVTCDWQAWTAKGTSILSASGCGASVPVVYGAPGSTGNAGTRAPGAGGVGGSQDGTSTSNSGAARTWGGGVGSGGTGTPTWGTDQYGGPGGSAAHVSYYGGGGAGNPGGAASSAYGATAGQDGTGGVLLTIVRGDVSLTTGHAITANGKNGGNGVSPACGGGGSGGGFVGLYRTGNITGTPNLAAAGGNGGTGAKSGGTGGAGFVESATFVTMGWTS